MYRTDAIGIDIISRAPFLLKILERSADTAERQALIEILGELASRRDKISCLEAEVRRLTALVDLLKEEEAKR